MQAGLFQTAPQNGVKGRLPEVIRGTPGYEDELGKREEITVSYFSLEGWGTKAQRHFSRIAVILLI